MYIDAIISALGIHSQGGWGYGGYGMGPGMMGGYGYGHGFIGTILLAIVVAAVVIGIIVLIRGTSAGHRPHGGGTSTDEAMDILRSRYAKGEIDKEEFEERKKALQA
jgi:putative membrane protein